MKKDLQDILFIKYPKIFRQKYLSMKKTAMCWGIDCDDGWFWLIDNLCECIQNYISLNKETPQIEATQVKQKYGGLRFYFEPYDETISNIIMFADYLSYKICEECGSIEDVQQTKGYIQSLCKKCREKRT